MLQIKQIDSEERVYFKWQSKSYGCKSVTKQQGGKVMSPFPIRIAQQLEAADG
jgi:hypothetical protein